MSDLISRLSLKQSIVVSAILEDKKTLEQIIDEEPSVDAVLIVRCEECKHYKQSNVADRKMCSRKDADGVPVCYDFLPDDWCKYGER